MNPVPSSAFVVSAILLCIVAVLVNFGLYRHTACTDTVYVGDLEGQVAISRDRGETWSTVTTNGDWILSVKADGDHVYASTAYGIAISHDGGISWSIKHLQTDSSCGAEVDSVFVNEDKHVYALLCSEYGCNTERYWQRVAVSFDNGDTWPINFPLPDPPFTSTANNIYVDGPRIYIATTVGLGYTDDMGATWTFKDQSSGLGSSNVLSVIGRGETICAGLISGVSTSKDDGRTWKTVNSAATGLNYNVYSMYLQDNTLYVATNGGGLSWSNDFTTWTRKTTADGLASNNTYTITGSGDNLYLGTYGGLSISHDKGRTWITKTTKDGLPSNYIYSVFVQCV